MATLVWNSLGERRFEAGVDRGVLYPRGKDGVAWNGLISVNENPSAGSSNEYYQDGRKVLDVPGPEDFAATIEAFTYPDEFSACDGTATHALGFNVGHQRRQPFGLSYRTGIGNDISGTDHGYKIHLIYNALAAPSDKAYQTLSGEPEASTFTWQVSTTPVTLSGYRPTAHLIFDSTKMSPAAIQNLESVLYGDETTGARLPTPAEIITLVTIFEGLAVVDNGNGTITITGDETSVVAVDPSTYSLTASSIVDNGNGTFTLTYSA